MDSHTYMTLWDLLTSSLGLSQIVYVKLNTTNGVLAFVIQYFKVRTLCTRYWTWEVMLQAMNGENQLLVKNEPVETQYLRKTTDSKRNVWNTLQIN